MAAKIAFMLRDCTESDESFMRRLHRRCYHDVVVRQFGEWDESKQQGFFDRSWNPDDFQIVVVDEVDVGALAVRKHEDHVRLAELQIDPNFSAKGNRLSHRGSGHQAI